MDKRSLSPMTLIYFVSGMFCGSCARTVELQVRALPGVASAHLNFSHRLLRVELQPGAQPEHLSQQVENAIRRGGFEAQRQRAGWLPSFLEQLSGEQARAIPPWLLCLVFFFAMWSSTAAFAGYLGGVSSQERWLLAALSTALGLPALLLGVVPFAKAGIRSLWRVRRLTLDLFIALGGICAAIFSLKSVVSGASQTYVDSAAMVLTLLLGAKLVEGRLARRMARGILDSIHGQDPTVTRVGAGGCRASQVRRGDQVAFQTGETILFDGTLVEELALVDNHLLSGEPTDRRVNRGQAVSAGSIARTALTLLVRQPMGSRLVDGWAEMALTAASRSHRYERWLQWAEARLTLLALSGSLALCLLTYLRSASLEQSLQSFFIGVLIFCPCLFASILPYAKQLAHLSLARGGIMCHRADCLFDLWAVRHLVFDKTGTLENLDSTLTLLEPDQKDELSGLLESLRQASPHPVLDGLTLPHNQSSNLAEPLICPTAGQGVQARWPDRQEWVVVGRAGFVRKLLGQPARDPEQSTLVARNGRVVAEIVPGAVEQEHALEVLRRLHHERPELNLMILSGDPRPLSGPLKDMVKLGVLSYHGNLSPEQKAARMPPDALMVGDGLNDILALARAAVSVRTGVRGRGFGVVDLELPASDLRPLIYLLRTSKRFVRVLTQTAAMATVYNLIAWLLAAFGLFSPLGAVCAMLSSLALMTLSCLRILQRPNSQPRPQISEQPKKGRRPGQQRHVDEAVGQRSHPGKTQDLAQPERAHGVHSQWEHSAPVQRTVGQGKLLEQVPPDAQQHKHGNPPGGGGPEQQGSPLQKGQQFAQQRHGLSVSNQSHTGQSRDGDRPHVDPVGWREIFGVELKEHVAVENQ